MTTKYYTNIPCLLQEVNGFFTIEISERSGLKTYLAKI